MASAPMPAVPLVERLEDHEHRAEIRAVAEQKRLPGNDDAVGHALGLRHDLVDLVHHVLGAFQRGGVGQLRRDDFVDSNGSSISVQYGVASGAEGTTFAARITGTMVAKTSTNNPYAGYNCGLSPT